MKKYAAAVGLLAGLIGASAPALAQTSDAPCPTPKTVIRLSDGDSIEAVSGSGGGVCKFKNLRTARSFERIFGAFLSRDPNFERARGLLPLEVGKRVSFTVSGPDDKGFPTNWSNSLSVEKYERTTVPAGTFDAFVILFVEQLFDGNGLWEHRWWYAPEVGYVVNSKYRAIRGTPPRRVPSDWYVVEIKKN